METEVSLKYFVNDCSTPKTLDCETPVNINSEQSASPPSLPLVSTPNVVNKNAQESSFTDSARSSPFSAPPAVTPKNTDFHAGYLALTHFSPMSSFYTP